LPSISGGTLLRGSSIVIGILLWGRILLYVVGTLFYSNPIAIMAAFAGES
jgi:hypothetical protein